MRPRPDAAENASQVATRSPRWTCFNEAAARCRGKRELGEEVVRECVALQ